MTKKTKAQDYTVIECCHSGLLRSSQSTECHFIVVVVLIAQVSTRTACLSGKSPPTKNGKPLLEGISSELVNAMKTNLRTIPGLKWQYYGNKEGVMFSYPADGSCSHPTYDPRLRFSYFRTRLIVKSKCYTDLVSHTLHKFPLLEDYSPSQTSLMILLPVM